MEEDSAVFSENINQSMPDPSSLESESDAVRIAEKTKLKRAELVAHLVELGWSSDEAEAETHLWKMSAVMRSSGTWLGAVDMTYRYHDGKLLCWRDILKKYSNEVNTSAAVPPPVANLSRSSSEEYVGGEFAHWRAKKRKVEPEVYHMPLVPPPPMHIPLPVCKSSYLQNHCWYLAVMLIKAKIEPGLIRIWQVKVAKKAGKRPGALAIPHFIGHEGTVFKNYAAITTFLKEYNRANGKVAATTVSSEVDNQSSSRPQTRRGTRESSGRWAGINSRSSSFYASDEPKSVAPPTPPVVTAETEAEVETIEEDEATLLSSLRVAHLESRLDALDDKSSQVLTEKERRDLLQFREDNPTEFGLVVKLAHLLATSKHAVVFTGAGISTGSGADLPTIRGKFGVSNSQLKEEDFDPACVQRLKPTVTHMAIVALLRNGYVRFVCSQNIENLHKLSGIPDEQLWEAHGNVCVATCPNCGQVFPLPPESKMCDNCWDPCSSAARRTWRTGMLKRSVISHYGAKVNVPLSAKAHAKESDLALILGTSLSVQPFAKMAQMPGKLAIVNIERTRPVEAEDRAKNKGLRLWKPCDDVLRGLLLVLGIRLINPPNVENLPAFLEHGEEDLDVAAIFMGGRRAYTRPKESTSATGSEEHENNSSYDQFESIPLETVVEDKFSKVHQNIPASAVSSNSAENPSAVLDNSTLSSSPLSKESHHHSSLNLDDSSSDQTPIAFMDSGAPSSVAHVSEHHHDSSSFAIDSNSDKTPIINLSNLVQPSIPLYSQPNDREEQSVSNSETSFVDTTGGSSHDTVTLEH